MRRSSFTREIQIDGQADFDVWLLAININPKGTYNFINHDPFLLIFLQ